MSWAGRLGRTKIGSVEVHAVSKQRADSFSFDDLQTTLRVNLREAVQADAAVDIQIKFKGSVAGESILRSQSSPLRAARIGNEVAASSRHDT